MTHGSHHRSRNSNTNRQDSIPSESDVKVISDMIQHQVKVTVAVRMLCRIQYPLKVTETNSFEKVTSSTVSGTILSGTKSDGSQRAQEEGQ